MNKEGYPEVQEVKKPLPTLGYKYSVEWYEYQYECMKYYFIKVLSGWSVKDFFDETEYENIAIYSVTDFSDMVIKDLVRGGVNKIIIADGNPGKYPNGFKNYKVLSVDNLYDLYKKKIVKKIIVCNVFRTNEIMQSLLQNGFDLSDIITFKTILEN